MESDPIDRAALRMGWGCPPTSMIYMGCWSAHPNTYPQLFSFFQVDIVVTFHKSQAQVQAHRQFLDPSCEKRNNHGTDPAKVVCI